MCTVMFPALVNMPSESVGKQSVKYTSRRFVKYWNDQVAAVPSIFVLGMYKLRRFGRLIMSNFSPVDSPLQPDTIQRS